MSWFHLSIISFAVIDKMPSGFVCFISKRISASYRSVSSIFCNLSLYNFIFCNGKCFNISIFSVIVLDDNRSFVFSFKDFKSYVNSSKYFRWFSNLSFYSNFSFSTNSLFCYCKSLILFCVWSTSLDKLEISSSFERFDKLLIFDFYTVESNLIYFLSFSFTYANIALFDLSN